MPRPSQFSRRRLTLLIAGAGVVVAFLIAVFVPVPYVILSPGPTLNTLGRPGGHALIQVSGHPVYPTTGHLNMVTVSYQGGPSDSFNIFAALQAWVTPHYAVVPEAELFPPGQSQQQVVKQDTQQMVGSQETATAAALCQLGIKFDTVDTVVSVDKHFPASGVLQSGDVIVAVNGTPVTCKADAGTLIRSRPPGTTLALTVSRHGSIRHFSVTTANVGGRAVVGVSVAETYRFPFNVKITVGNIGGPSAGMMFALGIIDKLTPGNLTDGRFIAGTGEISPDGTVSPIGGIQQKLAGARAAGATVFLTPAANCAAAAAADPPGLRLVKVNTLSGALRDLRDLAAGRSVPAC